MPMPMANHGPSHKKRRKQSSITTGMHILAIVAAIVGPFLPAIREWGMENNSAEQFFYWSNPFTGQLGRIQVLYTINLVVSLIFFCVWLAVGYYGKEPKCFSHMWAFTWLGLTVFYLYRLFVTGGTLQARVDIILNNANTVTLLLAYVGLAYPDNTDYQKQPKLFQRFSVWVVSAFLLLSLLTLLASGGQGLRTAKVLSGCYAGLAFCFFAARLESFLPKQYIFIAVVFLYAFVQVFWSFEDVPKALPSELVFGFALFAKFVLGLLVLINYPVIAKQAKQFFEKKAEAQADAPLRFNRWKA